jgi:hypothetical protein
MKKMQVFAERLARLFDVVLEINANDYRITLDVGGMVDVYFRDDKQKISTRKEVIVTLQTIGLFAPESASVNFHWCLSSHEKFDGKKIRRRHEKHKLY